jgi:ATP-dependent DNA ligase
MLRSFVMPVQPVPMRAQLETRLPRGDLWRYEPKLDGFRGMLWHRTEKLVQLVSRNGRDLAPWFPELVQAGQALPVGTLVDGEIVIASDDGFVDFSALQARLNSARSHVSLVALERPAVLATFDALEIAGAPLADEALSVRRAWLERLLAERHPCLQLVEQTSDVTLAEDWLRLLPSIEGVVAKRADRRYAPGRGRDWVKIKRYRTVDCVVIGVAGDLHAPKLVLGLRHPDGITHHLGVTRALRSEAVGPLAPLMQQLGPEEGAIPSRWQHDAVPPWRPISTELVCEIQATTIDVGRWLRQPANFLRWRPDLRPDDCSLDQLRH